MSLKDKLVRTKLYAGGQFYSVVTAYSSTFAFAQLQAGF